MKSTDRIITRLPLVELWNESGVLSASERRAVSGEDIAALLRLGPVRFVVAEVGHKPRWLAVENCYSFCKDEVNPHLAPPGSRVELDTYPGGYCFFGFEWTDGGATPIVVLQRSH